MNPNNQDNAQGWSWTFSGVIAVCAVAVLFAIGFQFFTCLLSKSKPQPVSQTVNVTVKMNQTAADFFRAVVVTNIRPGDPQKEAEDWLRISKPDSKDIRVGSMILFDLLKEESTQERDPAAYQVTHDLASKMMDSIESAKNKPAQIQANPEGKKP